MHASYLRKLLALEEFQLDPPVNTLSFALAERHAE